MTSSQKRFRVAIVGGGIAGLILAQLLSTSPDIEAHVYERNSESEDRLAGYRIQLSLETLELLKTHLPLETWEKLLPSVAKTPKEGYYHSCFMRPDGHIFYTYLPDEFRSTAAVSRLRLRKGLIHGSADFLQLGRKFSGYEELEDGSVRAHFTDGSSCVCDLLVGADGISSRVRRQLLPHIKTVQTDTAIIYFKVPYTREVESMIPYKTGCLVGGAYPNRSVHADHKVLYPNGQEITIMTWQSPEQPYARGLDPEHIGPETSYIMVGFGSRLGNFINRSKPPTEMSPMELKAECIARVHEHPTHPSIKALVELIVTDSCYTNIFRMVEVPRAWDSDRVTLVGDAAFNMAPFLGKGAACAIMDAVDLANTVARLPHSTAQDRRLMLRQYVDTMRERRLKERKRSAFVMNICFFGTTAFRAALRDYGMELANFWLTCSVSAKIFLIAIGLLVVLVWGPSGVFLTKISRHA